MKRHEEGQQQPALRCYWKILPLFMTVEFPTDGRRLRRKLIPPRAPANENEVARSFRRLIIFANSALSNRKTADASS
jgi:hypothetical protein